MRKRHCYWFNLKTGALTSIEITFQISSPSHENGTELFSMMLHITYKIYDVHFIL